MTQNDIKKYIQINIDKFQQYKGKATTYCYNLDVGTELIYNVVQRFFNKNPKSNIYIVVDTYETRQAIVNKLYNNDITENFKIVTSAYVNKKYYYATDFIIIYGINDDLELIKYLEKFSKFTFNILTKNLMDANFNNTVRAILPLIEIVGLMDTIMENIVYSPVEEYRIGINLDDDNLTTYKKYTDYINSTVSIFNSLDVIEHCRIGDSLLNINYMSFCADVAEANGWNAELDMSIPYMKEIDRLYNPNAIHERACMFYDISKRRRDLLTDGLEKLNTILDICKNNINKKILIISKRGDFASKITKFLLENDINCADYHDSIEPNVGYNENGDIILYKSGPKKGTPRIFGSQMQSTMNEYRFNNGFVNVLSIKNTSNNKLKVSFDIAIITSPLCDNVFDIKKRFIHSRFTTNPNIVYKLYYNGTMELDKMQKSLNNPLIKPIYNLDDKNIEYNENSGEIIL